MSSFLCVGFNPTSAIVTWQLSKSANFKVQTYWPTHTVQFDTQKLGSATFQSDQLDLNDTAAQQGQSIDVILIVISSIKDVARMCKKIAPFVSKNTLILVEVSGGIGCLQKLVKRSFPKNPVSGIICDLNTRLFMDRQTGVWHVRQYTTGSSDNLVPSVILEPGSKQMSSIEMALTAGGCQVTLPKTTAQFASVQWEREIAVVAFEVLSVMFEIPSVQKLVDDVVALPIVEGTISELLAIAAASGVKTLPSKQELKRRATSSLVRKAPRDFAIPGATRVFYEFYEHINFPLDFLVLLPILLSDELPKGVRTPYLESVYAVMTRLIELNKPEGVHSELFVRCDVAKALGMGSGPTAAAVGTERGPSIAEREELMAQKEASIEAKLAQVGSRELALGDAESKIQARELSARAREDALAQKERTLQHKDGKLRQMDHYMRQRDAQGDGQHYPTPIGPLQGPIHPPQTNGSNVPIPRRSQSQIRLAAIPGSPNPAMRQGPPTSPVPPSGFMPQTPPLKRRGQSMLSVSDALSQTNINSPPGIPTGKFSRGGPQSRNMSMVGAQDPPLGEVPGNGRRRQSLKGFGGGGYVSKTPHSQNFQLDDILGIASSDRYGMATRNNRLSTDQMVRPFAHGGRGPTSGQPLHKDLSHARSGVPSLDAPEFNGFSFSDEAFKHGQDSAGHGSTSSGSQRGSGSLSGNSRTPPHSPSVTPPTPHTLDPGPLPAGQKAQTHLSIERTLDPARVPL